ncbi:hypothetical protein ADK65_26110 [Streptomyces sp. NRRL B-1140]|uniref:hypothetical protein n=1 Tax=Streptomyces sp. NRRL B-1140 TaxID=1415549 RepID=UPI0006AF0FC9|nr:hypothetical protein [Streptomyces sp. NRRL B-1140]KOV97278.1 hypothetical protein ADK65_26110 [Streptomyces sp. NRRL B-1140]
MIHPYFERVVGPRIQQPAVPTLLDRFCFAARILIDDITPAAVLTSMPGIGVQDGNKDPW